MRRSVHVLLLAALLGPLGPASVTPATGTAGEPLEPFQWNLERIEARAAWQAGADGSGVVVAVVDTGVDGDHPEFSGGKLVNPANCTGAVTPSACQQGRGVAADDHGHGTHVAGIVAAPLDGSGIAGVAPRARIMPVKVLDAQGNGSARDVAVGIDYAVAHGADVVNLSLSGLPVVSQLTSRGVLEGQFARAIERASAAGVLVVLSAGNDGAPLCGHKIFREEAGLCVGATDVRDVKAGYSNFGPGTNVVAPGGSAVPFCDEGILSTSLVTHTTRCGGAGSGYAVLSGTSMAAPHVAGVGALLAQRGIRGSAAATRIAETAEDRGLFGYDYAYGDGLVNARRAVTADTSFAWWPVAR